MYIQIHMLNKNIELIWKLYFATIHANQFPLYPERIVLTKAQGDTTLYEVTNVIFGMFYCNSLLVCIYRILISPCIHNRNNHNIPTYLEKRKRKEKKNVWM